VIGQLRNLVDDFCHQAVEIVLVHNSERIAHVHAIHGVDHFAGILRKKAVGSSPDVRRIFGIRSCLGAESVSDIRP